MAAAKFDRRRQLQGETFDSVVIDLNLNMLELDQTWKMELVGHYTEEAQSGTLSIAQRHREELGL